MRTVALLIILWSVPLPQARADGSGRPLSERHAPRAVRYCARHRLVRLQTGLAAVSSTERGGPGSWSLVEDEEDDDRESGLFDLLPLPASVPAVGASLAGPRQNPSRPSCVRTPLRC
jgi:hypothetical protein